MTEREAAIAMAIAEAGRTIISFARALASQAGAPDPGAGLAEFDLEIELADGQREQWKVSVERLKVITNA